MADANTLKDQGNKAFSAKEYDKAINLFSQAIAIDPKNHVLYSNRSAAKAGKKQWAEALADAEQCIAVNPSWSKGYARKGAALHGARRFDDAIAAYEAGLKLEDSPALRKGLKEVQDAKSADASEDALGLGKMFADPNLFAKLAANPRTAKHLADPNFAQTLQMIQKNPALANSLLSGGDPRMIDVLGALMGIDMQAFNRPEGSDELPEGYSKVDPSVPKSSPPPPQPAASSSQPSASTSAPPPPTSEDVEMDEEVAEEAKAKKEAEEAKRVGGEAYKKRNFDEASQQFQKAWDLWPKDITFLTNLAAVYFEQGDYDKAIETCEKAVEEGRSLRADYKLIAKAYGRTGTAYSKKGDLPSAIKFYEKSLTEHRTPDILNKLREAERAKAEMDRQAYIDPEKSHIAREEGNNQFKSGDFAGAVKSYTESIKRDPSDARGYNNRAAAYTKLVALPDALKDANEAIKIDPSFVKAYIRKSNILFSMRDYTKALEAVQEATDHDTERKHSGEISQQEMKIQQAIWNQRGNETQEETLERAMRDPEVAGIMNDPIMQQILQQAQSDPQALQDHMKNPVVRGKIQKLINAGIIRTR
ncbi:activator of Hsp70 and Hsp90 chaperone [Desarmillaria tabescens]|uniref:Activator of Hsp70 and Hsp90 chaperone n=1 Tax=Armillaria tabescens TaxID=1929756 RepID=A0AA39TRH4_ARMTA|nr:activator of Hsp70 and Hsp90 chaperone [Desarmillaria tabescens]KAK0467907.1 activator of Hsp70 and Hsp90 chaperone [Desarmillaria tabescens]